MANISPLAIGITAAQGTGLTNVLDPLGRFFSQLSNGMFPNSLIPMQMLLELRARDYMDKETFYSMLAKHGVSREYGDRMVGLYQPTLRADQIYDLERRKKISQREVKMWRKIAHIDDAYYLRMKDLMEWLPPPQDLVRFAVREVYNRRIRERFQLDQDFPEKFREEAAKVGLPPEQAENYWAAHWMLPSANQGYEMLHREIIQQPDLELLLKALDVMPFWRDKMIQLSYNPITRVDVRRMWRIGVINTRDELERRYRAVGYSPADAEKMADFTELYESDDMAGITRANIMNSFKDSLINETDMRELFEDIGMSENAIEFWIRQALFEKTEIEVKKIRKEIEAQYRLGEANINQIKQHLYERNLPNAFVDSVVNDLTLQTSLKIKLPSKEDILRWLENDIIDENQFMDYMKLQGYKRTDIINYLIEYTLPNEKKKRRFLKVDTYKRWLTSGIVTKEYFIDTMIAQGISQKDIAAMLKEAGRKTNEGN